MAKYRACISIRIDHDTKEKKNDRTKYNACTSIEEKDMIQK